jgi:hypothetical protein
MWNSIANETIVTISSHANFYLAYGHNNIDLLVIEEINNLFNIKKKLR